MNTLFKTSDDNEQADTTVPVELESDATDETAEAESTDSEAVADESTDEPTADEAETAEANETETSAEAEPDDRAEFCRMRDESGADVASEVFAAGGSYDDALRLHAKLLRDENKMLKDQIASSDGDSGATFAARDETRDAKPLFNMRK